MCSDSQTFPNLTTCRPRLLRSYVFLNNLTDISVDCPMIGFVVDQAELCSGVHGSGNMAGRVLMC